jgi:hypothetical protein
MRHYARGQVLPLWAGAIVTTLMFAFLAINYGNTIRYQIRAQNAADSVAQGLMALQAERFNKLEVSLYATAVEEYRLRHVLDGILLAANDSGGCQAAYSTATYSSSLKYYTGPFAEGTCAQTYHDLTLEYAYSLNRYTTDAELVNDFSTYSTYANFTADTAALLTHLSGTARCNTDDPSVVNVDGTDCAFTYTILGEQKRAGLEAVQQDAQNIFVPDLNRSSSEYGTDSENQSLFAPAEIDVTACAVIPPLIPNFGPMQMKSQFAVGRAAATTVQFEEDWLQPGAVNDPTRPPNTFFQPDESYTNFTASSSSTTGSTSEMYNWYGVDFGGNAATAYVNYGVFNSATYDNEFSVRLGWWNSVAIKPFATAPAYGQICP